MRQAITINRQHLPILDGFRGIAAISVMLYHYTLANQGWFPQGYLAVDLFFVLSGFVIAFSYEEKLRSGLPPVRFMIRRLVRLYPMVVIASVLGVVATYAKLAAQPHDRDLSSLIGFLLYALALIPQFQETYLGKDIFPLNVVLWTLFFEVFANVIYGLFAFRLKSKYLIAIVCVAFCLMAVSGPLGGSSTDDFSLGFPRVIVGFFAGVLLYRHRFSGLSQAWNFAFLPVSALLIATFWLPFSPRGLMLLPLFGFFAIVVVAGTTASAPPGVSRVARFLGDISYPLYALHLPLHSFLSAIERKLSVGRVIPTAGIELLSSLCVVMISAAVLKLVDEPVRARLTGCCPDVRNHLYRGPTRNLWKRSELADTALGLR